MSPSFTFKSVRGDLFTYFLFFEATEKEQKDMKRQLLARLVIHI